jgi:hypothetical protein
MLPLQRLEHANIARYHESGLHAGLAFVACELVKGEDTAQRLSAGRRPWREVLSIAVQAARALKHAHNRNILHRDLKPAHFMLTADGTLKILGFGMTKIFKPGPPNPTPAIGSAAYLPPETASGKPLTRRSDFYSLGGVLYTLVTGRPPFAAASLVELMHKQCYTLPERPAMLVPDLPPELDEFICILLDKNPARRPATAATIIEELERIRGKLERKGERLDWPARITPDTAETTALPAALGGAGKGDESSATPRPLMRRPAIVIPLFLVSLVAIILPFTRSTPSAEELYTAALPLLASDDPNDWSTAAERYLDPLSQRYPDRYTTEVLTAREKIRDRRELRRAIAEGAKVEPASDAEKAYWRGLRLAQAGDPDGSRRTWRAIQTAFATVPSETRWVELAGAGLAELERTGNRVNRVPSRVAFDTAMAHARSLPADQRDEILRALAELVRDEPALADEVRRARNNP